MSTNAMSLTGIDGSRSDASQGIFSWSYGFHMSRVDAASISAEVINIKSIRYGADQQFIGEPMGLRLPAFYLKPTVSGYPPIALPFPAACCFENAIPKSHISSGIPISAVTHGRSSSLPATIVCIAPCASMNGLTTGGDDTL